MAYTWQGWNSQGIYDVVMGVKKAEAENLSIYVLSDSVSFDAMNIADGLESNLEVMLEEGLGPGLVNLTCSTHWGILQRDTVSKVSLTPML